MRKFEKISFDQFKLDVCDDTNLYDTFNIPARSTKDSAGYDFESLYDFVLEPNEIKKIPMGIKASMNTGEVLLLAVRSSMGFKYNVRMCNQIGIIDKDYYNNVDNEGHIWIKIQNEGKEKFVVKKGDKIVQGIFIQFLTIDNEEKIEKCRISGIGSTNEESE